MEVYEKKNDIWIVSKQEITHKSFNKTTQMLIKTFRTLVSHCNCNFVLNSNSPKLKTSCTSHSIFLAMIALDHDSYL